MVRLLAGEDRICSILPRKGDSGRLAYEGSRKNNGAIEIEPGCDIQGKIQK